MQIEHIRRTHHLYDRAHGVVYCYIAKNACSTLKYHFLKNLPEVGGVLPDEEINLKLHELIKRYSISRIPLETFDDKYVFAIVRHPFHRIVSAFLDKFVRSSEVPRYARTLMRYAGVGNDPTAWTFADFVKAIVSSPIETLNEHWMPQYLHFYENADYDLIPIDALADNYRLRHLYGNVSGNVRNHSLTYADVDRPAHLVPVQELKRMRHEDGIVPSWHALVQPELEGPLMSVYEPDVRLYERATSQAVSQTSRSERKVDRGTGTSARRGYDQTENGEAEERADNALISVILPIYNVERYVKECMDSLVAQEDQGFELIAVDDGSTDSSIEIVASYADHFGSRLRIVRQENKGLGGARNTGVQEANGEFSVFIDSDDLVSRTYVALLRQYQSTANYDVVTAGFQRISETGELVSGKTSQVIPSVEPPLKMYELVLGTYRLSVAWGRLYRTRLLREPDLAFPENVPHEDWFFTYKVLRRARKTFATNESIYYWRQREGSLGKSISKAHIDVASDLRRDTNQFLESENSSYRERQLAARRNLNILRFFDGKVRRYDPSSRNAFYGMLNEEGPRIRQDIDLVIGSPLCDEDAVNKAKRMLVEAEKTTEMEEGRSVHAETIDIVFMPLRAYHLNDCLPVLEYAKSYGWSIDIVETDSYRKGNSEVSDTARDRGIRVTTFEAFVQRRPRVRCIVMWNDWDPLMRIVAEACQNAGTTTVGWVEGIQDYLCADMADRPLRCPYRRSAHVVLPGPFDKRYFKNTSQDVQVGEIVRIARLWRERSPSDNDSGRRKALINSNFSYGVLEECRGEWLSLAVGACIDAGFEPVISRHPFDMGELYPEYETNRGFFDVVRDCNVTIQRFASGILEALALGVPVVYFNPHGERVDKFKKPNGAYLMTETRGDLEEVLRNGRYQWDEEKAKSFLALHAGLRDGETIPGERIAEILHGIVASTEVPSTSVTEQLGDLAGLKQPKALRKRADKIGPFYGEESHVELDAVVTKDVRSCATKHENDAPHVRHPWAMSSPAGIRNRKTYPGECALARVASKPQLGTAEARFVLLTYAGVLLLNGRPATAEYSVWSQYVDLIHTAKSKLGSEHPAVRHLERVQARRDTDETIG